ncbi:MAG: hypothetical protein L0287_33650 [Anaerolineae bacterium]|nr:hypothetical protein [Anaerolineae bacterium]MCI0610400.1 hypothetical protein [Anaerolineae bacterium]
MKVYSQLVCLLIVFFLMAACTPAATSTQEAVTAEPQPTIAEIYHPLTTRTEIAEIDAVLAAVESDDPQALRDLFSYTTAACMTVNALGGPPSCRDGEAEGTLVEVFPFLGADGGHLRKDEMSKWEGIEVSALYAIYRVSENVNVEEYYPAGEYAIMFIRQENRSAISLRVSGGGIVRVDYIFDISSESLNATLQREASEIILAQKE